MGLAAIAGLLGLDSERFDTREWNPLGSVVRPGDHVRADTTAGGELTVYCCYPPECAALQQMDGA